MHTYHVAYQYYGPCGHGFGYRIVSFNRLIDSPTMVAELIKRVEGTLPPDTKIIPLNWLRLSGDGETSPT